LERKPEAQRGWQGKLATTPRQGVGQIGRFGTGSSYDAYGKQTITGPSGGVRSRSSVGWDRGFTGYVADSESGLAYARSRMYSPTLGRFVGRDKSPESNFLILVMAKQGYADGLNLYSGYLVPNGVDPYGYKVGTCDAGWAYIQVKPASTNGCGPGDWKGNLVPNKPFGFMFKAPCDNHDIGYGTCGRPKATTDNKFLSDMNSVCEQYGAQLIVDGSDAWAEFDDPPMWWVIQQKVKQKALAAKAAAEVAVCKVLAQTYYQAVKNLGETPHTDAQKEDCKCFRLKCMDVPLMGKVYIPEFKDATF